MILIRRDDCVYLILLFSHLICYFLCEFGFWHRCWFLGCRAAVAEPLSESLMSFL